MGDLLEKLNVASYKGVRFACNDTTTYVGRAIIKHEFANSDVNNLEDQGLIPRGYALTAIIYGPDYIADRDALLAAIESPGPGVLIHPFYGRIERAVAQPVTFDETVKTLGRTEIPIMFEISDSNGIPSDNLLTTGRISQAKDDFLSSLIADFGSTFGVDNRYTGNLSAAVSKATDFVNAVTTNVQTTFAGSSSTAFLSKVDSFKRNITNLIAEPMQMATGVVGIISDISGLYDTPEQVLSVSQKFFDFGSDDVMIVPSTPGLRERLTNQNSFNDAVRSASLAVAYESAALNTYRTTDDVDKTSRSLEKAFKGIFK